MSNDEVVQMLEISELRRRGGDSRINRKKFEAWKKPRGSEYPEAILKRPRGGGAACQRKCGEKRTAE